MKPLWHHATRRELSGNESETQTLVVIGQRRITLPRETSFHSALGRAIWLVCISSLVLAGCTPRPSTPDVVPTPSASLATPTATPAPNPPSATPTVVPTATPTVAPMSATSPADPAPTQTSTVSSGIEARVVNAEAVKLRAGPGNAYPVVKLVLKNDRVLVIGHSACRNYLIITPDGTEAWINPHYLDVSPCTEVEEITELPPTPTPTPHVFRTGTATQTVKPDEANPTRNAIQGPSFRGTLESETDQPRQDEPTSVP